MYRIKLIFLTAISLLSISTACSAEELLDASLGPLLEKIKAVYGVNLHYTQGPVPKFIGLNYSLADIENGPALKKAIILFVQEISLYPKDFFRDADCQDIYFVQKLFYKQKPADGVFAEGTNYIFYDYSRRSDNTPKIRHNIHHEFYHLIGSKHPYWKKYGPAWEALNRADFSYNKKYNSYERNPINFYAPPEPGFITDYAMVSAEEDRAEVFACMMIPEELTLMEQWAQKDRILFKKMEMMKEFLKGTF